MAEQRQIATYMVVAFLLYRILLVIQRTRAMQILLGVVVLAFGYGVARLLDLILITAHHKKVSICLFLFEFEASVNQRSKPLEFVSQHLNHLIDINKEYINIRLSPDRLITRWVDCLVVHLFKFIGPSGIAGLCDPAVSVNDFIDIQCFS